MQASVLWYIVCDLAVLTLSCLRNWDEFGCILFNRMSIFTVRMRCCFNIISLPNMLFILWAERALVPLITCMNLEFQIVVHNSFSAECLFWLIFLLLLPLFLVFVICKFRALMMAKRQSSWTQSKYMFYRVWVWKLLFWIIQGNIVMPRFMLICYVDR